MFIISDVFFQLRSIQYAPQIPIWLGRGTPFPTLLCLFGVELSSGAPALWSG